MLKPIVSVSLNIGAVVASLTSGGAGLAVKFFVVSSGTGPASCEARPSVLFSRGVCPWSGSSRIHTTEHEICGRTPYGDRRLSRQGGCFVLGRWSFPIPSAPSSNAARSRLSRRNSNPASGASFLIFLMRSIPKDTFSIRHISVDVAIKVLMELGPQALMAKFYVLSAYRNIPIHPDDCHLLGISAATISMSISRCPLVSAPPPSFLILLRPWLDGFYEPTTIFGSYSITLTNSISLDCPFIQVSVKDPLPHWFS